MILEKWQYERRQIFSVILSPGKNLLLWRKGGKANSLPHRDKWDAGWDLLLVREWLEQKPVVPGKRLGTLYGVQDLTRVPVRSQEPLGGRTENCLLYKIMCRYKVQFGCQKVPVLRHKCSDSSNPEIQKHSLRLLLIVISKFPLL